MGEYFCAFFACSITMAFGYVWGRQAGCAQSYSLGYREGRLHPFPSETASDVVQGSKDES